MPGHFWERWLPSREKETEPQMAEALRSSFAPFLSARLPSSSHVFHERRSSFQGMSIPALLGYTSGTDQHFEIFRSSVAAGFVDQETPPTWAGKYLFRELPPGQSFETPQALIVSGLAPHPHGSWEFRYGFHPNAAEIEPAFGRVLPNPELHQHTYGVLALSSDISRSSLLRFWLSRKALTSEELLPLITQDPLVLLHTRPLQETIDSGFRTLHFLCDRAGMIADVVENHASSSPENEAQILQSQVPPNVTIRQLGKLHAADHTWYVYSGVQAQMVRSVSLHAASPGVLAFMAR